MPQSPWPIRDPSGTTANKASWIPSTWVLITLIAASLLYAVPSIWFLRSYMQPSFDLAIYDQALWLLAHGETFATISGVDAISSHFSPILYPLSVLSFIPGGAVPEITFQSLLIASGVVPAWMLGRTLNQDPRWFVAIYAFHPAIIGGSWIGWRPWNLAVPLFMWFVAWIVHKPSTTRIVIAGLILLTFREDLAVWVGLAAIVLVLAGRVDLKTLVKSGAILGAATGLVVLWILPMLSSVEGYYFTSESQIHGGSPAVKIASVVSRTLFLLIPLAITPRRINWLLVAPLAIPLVGLLLRGGNSLTTFFHYDMLFVPMLLLAVGLSTQVSFRPLLIGSLSLLIMIGLGALRPVPPWGPTNPWRYDASTVKVYDEIRAVVNQVPNVESASMTMPERMATHYSERSNIFIYPHPLDVWRTADGEELELSTRFTCPEPTIVVAREEALTEFWATTIDDNYVLLSDDPQPFSIWMRLEPLPDDPCSAVRVYAG